VASARVQEGAIADAACDANGDTNVFVFGLPPNEMAAARGARRVRVVSCMVLSGVCVGRDVERLRGAADVSRGGLIGAMS